MELGPGETLVDGEIMYSAADLTHSPSQVQTEIFDKAVQDFIKATRMAVGTTARRSVRHARLKEAWAMCYCMVLALPHVPRACRRSIRRLLRHYMFWWVVGAIVAAVVLGVLIGFWVPA